LGGFKGERGERKLKAKVRVKLKVTINKIYRKG
jgi:hypothetical protein